MDDKQNIQKPGILRWLTVGLLCYGGWLVVNLVLALLFPVLLIAGYGGGKTGRKMVRGFCVWFLGAFFIKYFHAIGLLKVGEIPEPQAFASEKAKMYVANHRSWIDGLLLLALIPDVRIPVNAGYLKTPLVGSVMVWLGCIPLDRKSPEQTLRGVEEIRGCVRSETSVAVFPEATRSPKGRLKQFSGIFFRIVCEENIEVVPIILHTDYPFLGPKTENFLTAKRTILTIRILDPIAPQKGERGTELGRRVHKKMAPILANLDQP